ncbi:hypothetical protein ACEXQB_007980 [Herbiconiux sp. P18]|uniref:hypothetical protein n=1 Tax=Herbiconiux liangxiaofengii TaxID=3342795 RepID=UPI0035BB1B4E
MSLRLRTPLVLAALAVVLAASGCTAPSPVPTPTITATHPTPTGSPSATPTPSPTPTTTPTPTPGAEDGAAYDPADIATWQITYDGIGPVVLGRPLNEVVAEIPVEPNVCRPGVDSFFSSHIVAVAADEASPVNWAMTARSGSDDPGGLPSTDAGITVGSTADRIVAAYPSAEQYTPHGGGSAYRITDGTNWIIFELFDSAEVQAIWVLPEEVAPPEYCG